MKYYRRFIRINGEFLTSPRFTKKSDAENWYHEMRRKKQHLRDGLIIETSDEGISFIDYAREWMIKRKKNYPASTWKSDEQRLRVYILPLFSELQMTKITGAQIRSLLLRISEDGFLKKGFKISTETRNRVKALLSVIFSDALNEDPPVVNFNPVLGVKIKEKRIGAKRPRYLESAEACIKFISKAKELGPTEYVIACLFLMAGVRKQELIALRWKSFNPKKSTLEISERYEQATNSIKPGTKAGELISRIAPISSQLAQVLKMYHRETKYGSPNDFIVCRADGRYLGARAVSSIIEAIREKAGVDISAHGLRHTFGREFAANNGNLKALQAILGHSSSKTTDIYSELAGERMKGFGEAVSFDIGVKESGK